MANEVTAHVRLQEELHFVGVGNTGHMVDLDSPTTGSRNGPSPMELVLVSLAGCSGMDVMSILRKKRQSIQGIEVVAHGVRGEDYPKPYTAIQLEYVVTGSNVDAKALERAIELSRDSYCPVWAMLRPTVDISYTYRIVEG